MISRRIAVLCTAPRAHSLLRALPLLFAVGCGEVDSLLAFDAAVEPPPTLTADPIASTAATSRAPAATRGAPEPSTRANSRPQQSATPSATHAPPVVDVDTETEAGAPRAAAVDDASELAELVATRARTPIYVEPDARSRELGYLRSGAVVARASAMPGLRKGAACAEGFYAVQPKGFVCAADISLDPEHVLRTALARRPDRSSGLPYLYARPRTFGPVLYNRIPSASEQREREPEGKGQLPAAWRGLLGAEPPEFLAEGRSSLRLDGRPRSELAVSSGRAIADSAFAFLTLFEAEGRAYGLSTELSVVPLDRMELVVPSAFAGVPLGSDLRLPLVFVRAKNATLFSGSPERGLRVARPIEYREAIGLSGRRVASGGRVYLETQDGAWLVDGPLLTHIEAPSTPPGGRGQRTWIDVSIQSQTLVAYEGEQPVYATLVSTGADGLLDPETHRATVQGDFLVHTKHVTSTMDSDTLGDAYDLRDVPYVQYFSGSTALHAAFWHDAFGTPRSHGCINLSPLDARWLFDWTEPRVPREWHGAMSVLGGTLVRVHP